MRLFAALSLVTASIGFTGCTPGSKVERYTDNAIRACGQGNVAYVNVENGRYGCRR